MLYVFNNKKLTENENMNQQKEVPDNLGGLGVFRDRFHPKQSFVVGSGGVPIEEFLSWDIGNLLE